MTTPADIAGQYTLPGYEPSEADMVADAMSRPLAEKVASAIGLLQLYEAKALELSPEGYWLAYSGGKDSEVILDLARRAGVKHTANYSCTTLDPPELVRFIKREHPEVRWHRQPQALLTRVLVRNPPTRMGRWCCAEYKERGGAGVAKIVGVRVAESARRTKLWRNVVPHRKSGLMVCPIVYWTESDVWQYHRERNLPHCELYDQGFSRLGCIGCPLAGPAGQTREFARWPRYAAWWERSVKRFWELHHDGINSRTGQPLYASGFPTAQEFWDWWRSGGAFQGEPPACQGEFLFADDSDQPYMDLEEV